MANIDLSGLDALIKFGNVQGSSIGLGGSTGNGGGAGDSTGGGTSFGS
ncbi:hypothetical protein [Gordonia hydrophobica]|uniref:Uncharacterized protein n=1 Tax=Gordonia hydrophobica TaxID=40516 RepID=A0ABZ2U2M7_9ACTN|nr:hypothetical protein [Gordonia hydrophobica]MBM7367776.1 putative membrane protein YgcG [Gordonia hydrophobica]